MASIPSNDCDINQRAFSVFCDVIARDALTKNHQLRADNEALTKIEKTLRTVEILNHRASTDDKVLLTIDIPSFDIAYPSGFIYDVREHGVEFPLKQIISIDCNISGLCLSRVAPSTFGEIPTLTVSDDSTVVASIACSSCIAIEGRIEDFRGTLEDVRSSIESNRVSLYFMSLRLAGGLDAQTGEPERMPWDHDDSLLGATFKLDKICVFYETASPILASSSIQLPGSIREENDRESELNVLQRLSTVNPYHKELSDAVSDRRSLEDRNALLCQYSNLFQTIEVSFHYEGIGSILKFKFKDGKRGPSSTRLKLPEEELRPISLEYLRGMRIKLANIVLASRSDPIALPTGQYSGYLCMRYDNDVHALFTFDDSLLNVDENSLVTDIFSHARATLTHTVDPEGRVEIQTTTQDGRTIFPLTGITVCFDSLLLSNELFKCHLNLLAIDEHEGDEGHAFDDA